MLKDEKPVDDRDWSFTKVENPENDTEFFVTAPIKGLLAILRSYAAGFELKEGPKLFLTMLLHARYTDETIQAYDRLTDAINRASDESSRLAGALIAVTVAGVVLSLLVGIPTFYDFILKIKWW